MTDTTFSARSVPWATLDSTVEVDRAVSATEAVTLAGLDFEVRVVQDGYRSPVTGNWKVDKSKRKIVRLDTDAVLGTVSPTYELLPYGEAFDFMNELDAEYVAAGSMKNGRQAFIVAQLPDFKDLGVLAGDDPHELYVVLRASHDGSRPVEVSELPLRNKCMNMTPLPSFSRDAEQRWAVRHTKNMRDRLHEAQRVLENSSGYAEEYKKTAERLANVELSIDEVRRIIDDVVPSYVRTTREAEGIMDVYEHSTTNGYQGTAWGVLNAVTEHYDWYRGGDDRRPETRWLHGLDGATSQAVQRTARRLLQVS